MCVGSAIIKAREIRDCFTHFFLIFSLIICCKVWSYTTSVNQHICIRTPTKLKLWNGNQETKMKIFPNQIHLSISLLNRRRHYIKNKSNIICNSISVQKINYLVLLHSKNYPTQKPLPSARYISISRTWPLNVKFNSNNPFP